MTTVIGMELSPLEQPEFRFTTPNVGMENVVH